MLDPSFGRISILIDTFFILDSRLSLLMKLMIRRIKFDNIILIDNPNLLPNNFL